MNLSMSVLLSNLGGLFLLIGVGFIAVRGKWIPASATGVLTGLLMKITLPATIFASIIRPFDLAFLRDALVMFVLGLVLHPLYIGISWLLTRPAGVPRERRGMWMLCSSFCNNGFMGFPVVYAVLGDTGLALAAMIGVPFNLLIYTIGAKLTAMDQPQGSAVPKLAWRSVLLSGINLSIVAGLVLYCAQIPVPEVVMMPIRHLSGVTTPVSMMIVGMNLAKGRLADMVDKDAITASLTRLLGLPVLTWGLLRLLPISNPMVVSVTMLIMAMPSPTVATVMAEQYDGSRELAARTVCLSSLLSVVTIPIITMLL